MNKQLIGGMTAICMSISLTACQLARPEAGAAGEDALVGVFITYEPLDLFDAEGFLKNQPHSAAGGNHTMESTRGNARRIYATLKPKSDSARPALILNNSGEAVSKGPAEEYVFEGLVGIPFFAPKVQGEDPKDTYEDLMTNEAMQDVDFQVFISGEENKTVLEGTVYFQPNNNDVSLFIHPVYQTAGGQVYLTGESKAFTGHFGGEGQILSQTLDSSVDSMFNGNSKKITSSVKISLNAKFASGSVFLLQINESNQIIRKEPLILQNLPQKLQLEADTAYLIQELHGTDEDGRPSIQRKLIEKPAAAFSTFRPADKGILIRHDTSLIWR